MKHLVLLLILLLATTVPAAAEDYFIGAYAYTIDGADVRSTIYCQDSRRISAYRLTATDTLEHRYWLLIDERDLPDILISHTGLVAIEGTDMIWLEHQLGAQATVTVVQPGCWPRDTDPIAPRYARWLPLVLN